MTQIIPAILTESFEELQRQIRKTDGLFPYVQLDIMDGNFVHKISFNNVEKIPEIGTDLQYELHLMVNDPVAEMKKWTEVKNVFRAIAHLESPGEIEKAYEFAKNQNWEFGIAINPDTPLEKLTPHLDCIDLVLFMTVYPGRQGAPFQDQVLPKIEQYLKLEKKPKCAVDGGINLETINKFKGLPIDALCVGSALMMAPNIEKAYFELNELLK
jgi:ribulose-phosphate 3-epimerase